MTSLGVIERGRMIYRGAEADLYRGRWCGLPAVFKVRKKLSYRLDSLDREIRAQRTAREAQMLHRAKSAGVPTPYLYQVDMVDSTLVMEFVEGPRMKDRVPTSGGRELSHLFRMLGGSVARLHAAGIVHGDLTTSNAIIRGPELVLIDFGLASQSLKLEDQAVDLRLIKETITGAHSSVAAAAMKALLAGYGAVLGESRLRSATRQLREIERRGRYARVE